jgi:hypothetical protein
MLDSFLFELNWLDTMLSNVFMSCRTSRQEADQHPDQRSYMYTSLVSVEVT